MTCDRCECDSDVCYCDISEMRKQIESLENRVLKLEKVIIYHHINTDDKEKLNTILGILK